MVSRLFFFYYPMKLKTTILLLCFCFSAFAEEAKTQLIVWAKNETKVAYALDKKPQINFTDTTLIISVEDVEVSYPLDEMLRFTYGEAPETGILDLQTEESQFYFDGTYLLFPSLSAGTKVSLYTLGGALVFTKTVSTNGEYAFPLSNLSQGVYVVNVNGVTYKILKK